MVNYKTWDPSIILGYNNLYSSAFNNEKITWDGGVGYLRLAEYLNKNYGYQKSLAISREKGLILYYSGTVKNLSEINYNEDLIVDTKNNKKYLQGGYELKEVYSIKSTPRFYIYQRK